MNLENNAITLFCLLFFHIQRIEQIHHDHSFVGCSLFCIHIDLQNLFLLKTAIPQNSVQKTCCHYYALESKLGHFNSIKCDFDLKINASDYFISMHCSLCWYKYTPIFPPLLFQTCTRSHAHANTHESAHALKLEHKEKQAANKGLQK